MELILASKSPRRAELMGLFKKPFVIRVAEADETMDPGADPAKEVARVSRLKAEAVDRSCEDIVVAADTIVVCQGKILGKPQDREHAHEMLRLLSGKTHQVMTGLTVLAPNGTVTVTEVTDVTFRELSDREIFDYIDTKEPMDKAGSYGIQGGAALFCSRLEGDYYNVVGLPVCLLGEILGQIAPQWMGETE